MKGGGLTWVGWVMLGVGGMLVYAGMTGQSLVTELGAVLNGRKPGAAGSTTKAPPPSNSSANAAEHRLIGDNPTALPSPTYATGQRPVKPGEK